MSEEKTKITIHMKCDTLPDELKLHLDENTRLVMRPRFEKDNIPKRLMGFLEPSTVNMQWPLDGVGVRVVRYGKTPDSSASVQFWHQDGQTYQNIHFRAADYEKAVHYFKQLGFTHCDE